MKTRIAGVCLLLALIAAGAAQTGGDAGWTKYSSAEGRFSILTPAQPEEKSSTENGVMIHSFVAVDRPRLYLVVYSDYPEADKAADTTFRLNAERDGFLKGSKTAMVSERQFKFKGNSGELPALEFTSEGADVNYKSIVILDGSRVYMACAGALKGNDSIAQFEKFLGSFQLN